MDFTSPPPASCLNKSTGNDVYPCGPPELLAAIDTPDSMDGPTIQSHTPHTGLRKALSPGYFLAPSPMPALSSSLRSSFPALLLQRPLSQAQCLPSSRGFQREMSSWADVHVSFSPMIAIRSLARKLVQGARSRHIWLRRAYTKGEHGWTRTWLEVLAGRYAVRKMR